jgi:nucleoside 2-deoxyribosyltransferase
MLRVYPSSKVKHAPMWRKLQSKVPHLFLNARWLKWAEKENGLTTKQFRECQEDIETSDVLILYAEEGDVLKGALVEVGMALSKGIRVIFVSSDMLSYGTWVYNNSVTWVSNMKDAMNLLEHWDEVYL